MYVRYNIQLYINNFLTIEAKVAKRHQYKMKNHSSVLYIP